MALTKIDDRGLKTPIDLLDNEKIRFGTGNDLEIYHDGSSVGYIKNTTGLLKILSDGQVSIVDAGNNEDLAKFIDNGSCELYYDNSKKAETTSSGFAITGILSSNQTSGQAISLADNVRLDLGTGDDLQIQHTGSNAHFDNNTGSSYFNAASNFYFQTNNTESAITCTANGAVELSYDGTRKAYTNSGGFALDSHLIMGDGDIVKLGNGADLQLTHDGTDSTILNNTGNLLLYSANDFYIKHGTEVMLAAKGDSGVELYHNALKRLETTAAGVKVSRDTQCDFVIQGTADGFGGGLELHNMSNTNNAQMRIRSIDAAGDDTSEIRFLHDVPTSNSGSIQFWTRAAGGSLTERIRIPTTGGITFNGDTAASNALDDYEEGSWSPDFYYHSSVANVAGHYTKIGRMVYAYFTGTIYSTQSDHQRINNLPFTTADIGGGVGGVARGYQNFDIQDGPIYYVENNSTKVSFYKDNGSSMAASDCNGKSLRGMVVYTAAS